MSVKVTLIYAAFGNGTILNAYSSFVDGKGSPIYLVRVNQRDYQIPEEWPKSFQTPRDKEALKKGAEAFLNKQIGKGGAEEYEVTIVAGIS